MTLRYGPASDYALVSPCSPVDTAGDTGSTLEPFLGLATLNCGTTPGLDLIMKSDVRLPCAKWYGNNLCLVDSEAHVAAAVVARSPDVILFEELFDQARCDDKVWVQVDCMPR
jgi:hypothetical protein